MNEIETTVENLPAMHPEPTNPFQQLPQAAIALNSMMNVEALKGIAEIQASVMMAKKFPRDPFSSYNAIIEECKRLDLAENAVYAYPRGDTTVSGPSIRLAEVLARLWGNLDCGIRELSRDDEKSMVESYAWDMQTNVRWKRIFEVSHERVTKTRRYKLTDPRDIYENLANYAARRLRACILEAIPGDVVDAAVKACKETVTKKGSDKPIADRIRGMLLKFLKYGVTQAHIEKRIGHSVEIVNEEELFDLVTVFNSIKDGSKRSDFFEISDNAPDEKTAALKDKLQKSSS